MIFTRRFGALAARPQFEDAPELIEADLQRELEQDLELLRENTENAQARNESAA
ncbi:hypothetical protein [Kribbella deserti]|uniref:Uncharacterized protein n=1 Tax=Kribbella deserti TaxID=1926257 RepID=A0ABV6QD58_9ACTN